MELQDVANVGKWLRSAIGVPFIVVGGSAVERVVPVATKDVDVLIDSSDWDAVDTALESRKDAAPLEPTGGSIRGTVVTIGNAKIDLEFLSDEPFSGRSGPGSFTRYVRQQESVVHEGVRYATPAAVFYMRLNAPDDWRLYLPTIERDIESGVTPRTLDEAVRIADHFGVGPTVRGRVEALRGKRSALEPRRE
ncbi:MAG: hypothetical protein ABSA63_09085 [Thermoplasmata archaeon]|jgi:hypothetical protein